MRIYTKMKNKLGLMMAVMMIAGWMQVGFGQNLNEGLVAYYPFNGNANVESGNGNHGEVSGAALAEDRFGVADSPYELVADDVITVSNPFEGMQSFTKSLWFRGIDDESGLLRSSACEIKLYPNRFSIHFN